MDALKTYKERIEAKLKEKIPSLSNHKNTLWKACEYALMNGGKRFRPALVYMIADALGNKSDVSEAALAVEYFHTASLIADDLPCMDDDDERRERPSLHKVHGETVALLASYALIAAGYESLSKNAEEIRKSELPFAADSDRICVLALENATYNTGLFGATGGQYLDIFPLDFSLKSVRDAIHLKTISLFEISFVLGWLYGGGKINLLEKVKKAAYHFGMAFQIADDIGDVDQDKAKGRKVSIALVAGLDAAKEMFYEESKRFLEEIGHLGIQDTPFKKMLNSIKF